MNCEIIGRPIKGSSEEEGCPGSKGKEGLLEIYEGFFYRLLTQDDSYSKANRGGVRIISGRERKST